MSRLPYVFLVPVLLSLALCADATRAALYQPSPSPCPDVPVSDTLMGSKGSDPCYTPRDAARPTLVQGTTVKTDAAGAWAVTWLKPFSSPQPAVSPVPVSGGPLPIVCNVTVRTATQVSGRCWQASSTTVTSALIGLVGQVVSPFTSPAANTSVMVSGREPTQ